MRETQYSIQTETSGASHPNSGLVEGNDIPSPPAKESRSNNSTAPLSPKNTREEEGSHPGSTSLSRRLALSPRRSGGSPRNRFLFADGVDSPRKEKVFSSFHKALASTSRSASSSPTKQSRSSSSSKNENRNASMRSSSFSPTKKSGFSYERRDVKIFLSSVKDAKTEKPLSVKAGLAQGSKQIESPTKKAFTVKTEKGGEQRLSETEVTDLVRSSIRRARKNAKNKTKQELQRSYNTVTEGNDIGTSPTRGKSKKFSWSTAEDTEEDDELIAIEEKPEVQAPISSPSKETTSLFKVAWKRKKIGSTKKIREMNIKTRFPPPTTIPKAPQSDSLRDLSSISFSLSPAKRRVRSTSHSRGCKSPFSEKYSDNEICRIVKSSVNRAKLTRLEIAELLNETRQVNEVADVVPTTICKPKAVTQEPDSKKDFSDHSDKTGNSEVASQDSPRQETMNLPRISERKPDAYRFRSSLLSISDEPSESRAADNHSPARLGPIDLGTFSADTNSISEFSKRFSAAAAAIPDTRTSPRAKSKAPSGRFGLAAMAPAPRLLAGAKKLECLPTKSVELPDDGYPLSEDHKHKREGEQTPQFSRTPKTANAQADKTTTTENDKETAYCCSYPAIASDSQECERNDKVDNKNVVTEDPSTATSVDDEKEQKLNSRDNDEKTSKHSNFDHANEEDDATIERKDCKTSVGIASDKERKTAEVQREIETLVSAQTPISTLPLKEPTSNERENTDHSPGVRTCEHEPPENAVDEQQTARAPLNIAAAVEATTPLGNVVNQDQIKETEVEDVESKRQDVMTTADGDYSKEETLAEDITPTKFPATEDTTMSPVTDPGKVAAMAISAEGQHEVLKSTDTDSQPRKKAGVCASLNEIVKHVPDCAITQATRQTNNDSKQEADSVMFPSNPRASPGPSDETETKDAVDRRASQQGSCCSNLLVALLPADTKSASDDAESSETKTSEEPTTKATESHGFETRDDFASGTLLCDLSQEHEATRGSFHLNSSKHGTEALPEGGNTQEESERPQVGHNQEVQNDMLEPRVGHNQEFQGDDSPIVDDVTDRKQVGQDVQDHTPEHDLKEDDTKPGSYAQQNTASFQLQKPKEKTGDANGMDDVENAAQRILHYLKNTFSSGDDVDGCSQTTGHQETMTDSLAPSHSISTLGSNGRPSFEERPSSSSLIITGSSGSAAVITEEFLAEIAAKKGVRITKGELAKMMEAAKQSQTAEHRSSRHTTSLDEADADDERTVASRSMTDYGPPPRPNTVAGQNSHIQCLARMIAPIHSQLCFLDFFDFFKLLDLTRDPDDAALVDLNTTNDGSQWYESTVYDTSFAEERTDDAEERTDHEGDGTEEEGEETDYETEISAPAVVDENQRNRMTFSFSDGDEDSSSSSDDSSLAIW